MDFVVLEPEAAGDFGENAVIQDWKDRPLQVSKMHYEFETWPEDDLLEVTGVFIGTKGFQRRLESLDPPVTGIEFDACEISWDDQFEELYGDRQLKKYVWFRITGVPGKDDCGLDQKCRLVASRRFFHTLQLFSYRNCEVLKYEPETSTAS